METIRNYLETMFADLPATQKVLKAKNELWQMMEDKYSELIKEGKNENEAVGTVISEFGNLDELKEVLDLSEADVSKEENQKKKIVTKTDVETFLRDRRTVSHKTALGVMLCIICPVPLMITASAGGNTGIGIAVMFVLIAAALALFIYARSTAGKWKYIKDEKCCVNFTTAAFIRTEKEHCAGTYLLQITLGVVLCVLCWLPCMAIDSLDSIWISVAPILLILIVGVGCYLLVSARLMRSGFEILKKFCNMTLQGESELQQKEQKEEKAERSLLLEIYWPVTTCVYLIISFLTYAWAFTWIVWPIAGIVFPILCKLEKNRVNIVKEG